MKGDTCNDCGSTNIDKTTNDPPLPGFTCDCHDCGHNW
jgi:hypothetical protein